MSLELEIKALTTSINTLTAAVTGRVPAAVVAAPAPAPVAATPAPAAPAAAPMPAFAMPAAPAAVTPAPTGVPFSDPKGMLAYLMTAYQTMGPAKGAGIQGVLTTLGVGNVNEVKPEQYAALYAGVEQLRAAV